MLTRFYAFDIGRQSAVASFNMLISIDRIDYLLASIGALIYNIGREICPLRQVELLRSRNVQLDSISEICITYPLKHIANACGLKGCQAHVEKIIFLLSLPTLQSY